MEIYIQFNKFELRVTVGFSERARKVTSLSPSSLSRLRRGW